ncbi:hypothetical protein CWC22_002905 [Pseudoalteromonas rubra]|uniref:Big-1 domain-containing protein n=1 Tax=Pseudoalteromonas rubra TaxID=43658 RepID=A0A5S3V4Y3_9GAMM|nr:hypothetical protein [Pseudoalteromonas rubra]QPB82010.1 hypothetical protein CWC22_002905 [Pseudoalteromonas rubra]
MGNKQFKLTKLALALGVTVSLAGCFSDNDNNVDIQPPPTDTVKVVTPPTDQVVEKQAGSFTIVVADTQGNPLADTVTATITFPDGSEGVLNTAGAALGEDDTSSQASSFGFTVAEVPAEGVSIDFVVTAEGFLSNSGTVELTADAADVAELVRLTPRSLEQADGAVPIIATSSAIGDLAGEGVTATYTAEAGLAIEGADALTLEKNLDAAKNEKKAAGGVTVTVKNGTQFLDANDQPLTSAPTVTVAYFANEAQRNANETDDVAATESAIDAFPGGLALTVAQNETTNIDGAFSTGGFVAIEMVDEEGNKVSKFGEGNSIQVAMKVDKATSNPCPQVFDGEGTVAAAAEGDNGLFENGVCKTNPTPRQIAVDDIFPVWSYNEDAGEWSFESYGVVTADEDENASTFNVVVDVNHLSYWNLDFFTYILNAEKCDNRRVNFNIVDANDQPSQEYADVLVEANSYRLLIGAYNRSDLTKGTFRNPPSFEVKLKMMKDGVNILDNATDGEGNVVGGAADGEATGVTFSNLCDLNNGTLKLTTSAATEITKTLTPQLVCSNNSDADVPATPVTTPTVVQLFRQNRFVKTFYPSGAFDVTLEEGDAAYSVRFKNPNNNTWFTQDIAANATAATLDIPVTCTITDQPATGTGGN